MAETFITQCPHCGTSFRVKEEHLAIANGSVRCGACLQVFSARNHIVTAPSAAKPATGAAKPAARQTAPARPKAKPRPKPTPPPVEPPSAESGFATDDDDDADFLFSDGPDEDEEFIFEDKDDDLLDESSEDEELGEFSDHFLKLGNSQSSSGEQADPFRRESQEMEQDVLEGGEGPDESWAESILEELEREEKQQAAQAPRFESRETTPPRRRSAQTSDRDDFDSAAFTAEREPAPHTPGNKASQLVRQINHEIDLDFSAEGRFARWRWLGGVLILVLLATLAAQFAWLQRDTYAKMDQWRGLYQNACDLLGCQLPAQEDLDQIRASAVLVRDHKVLDHVKLLDAVLTNRAPFKQPFPVLILQYTDVNGELVADQAFRPEDYLRGELTGSTLMPMNTRVYVSIPLKDPGDRAVNYQLLMSPA